jgi:hypothetical protein
MGIIVPDDTEPWRAQVVDCDDFITAASFPALREQLTAHGVSEHEISEHAHRLEVVSELRVCGWRAPDQVWPGRRAEGIAALFRGPRTPPRADAPPPDVRGGF